MAKAMAGCSGVKSGANKLTTLAVKNRGTFPRRTSLPNFKAEQ